MADRFVSDLRGTKKTALKVGRVDLDASAATADRSAALPDQSGTLAMLADIAAHELAGDHTMLELPEISEPAAPAANTLRLYAVDRNGITELELKDASGLIHPVGEELIKRVRNTTGSTLAKSALVYVTGSTGSIPTVGLARSDSEATLPCTGLTVEAIANNAFGRVIHNGSLIGIDTSAFVEGDPVYVSSTVAGALQGTPPVYPSFSQKVGTVTNSGVGNGSILIEIDGVTTTAGATGREVLSTTTPADARAVIGAGPVLSSTGDLSEGANLYYTDARSDARARAVRWVSIKAAPYSAAGDGTTDDSAAFAAAAAAEDAIYVPAGEYRVDSGLDIAANQAWHFDGATLKHSSDTLKIIRADSVDGWSITGALRLVGLLTTPATASEVGLYIANCERFRVAGVEARKFKGIGIHVTGGTVPSFRGITGQFVNCAANENTMGIQIDAGSGAEYTSWANTQVCGNVNGIKIGAGNTVFLGGSITDNTNDGVQLVAGSNHGHGMFSGCNINHNVRYNVHALQVTNGYTFAGCHFYGNGGSAGAIWFDRCAGMTIDGGIIDCWVYNDADGSSGLNVISGVYCPGSYGDIVLGSGPNPGEDELWFHRCHGPGAYESGVTINDPSPAYAFVSRAAASTQSLTSGVAADLIFPAAEFNRRAAYNTSTGAFTAPSAGVYRLRAHALCSGSAMSYTDSYIDLKIGGSSRRLFAPNGFQASILNFHIDAEIKLSAADVVTLSALIIGTSPVFGNSTWPSTLSIERVS